MKKIAFFVEGQTEQIFINKLLIEIAKKNCIKIELFQLRGGKRSPPRRKEVPQFSSYTEPDIPSHEAWIFDCGNDEKVKSDIQEHIHDLAKNGVSQIIGIRDLFNPELKLTISDLARLEKLLHLNPPSLPPPPIPYTIIIAVHEVEAWFLAECNHFQRIDENLTDSFIKSNQPSLGFDPNVDDMSLRTQPSDDLKKIYQLVGKTYNKTKENVERTVNCLDYDNLCQILPNKMDKLNQLILKIDAFLT